MLFFENCMVVVSGASGMVGTAVVSFIESIFSFLNITKQSSIIKIPHHAILGYRDEKITIRNRSELSIGSEKYFSNFSSGRSRDFERILFIHCAGKVGGIKANDENKDTFLKDNSIVGINFVEMFKNLDVECDSLFINLGSSCIYPRDCNQPIKEEFLLTSPLEKTNEGYALAKILVAKYCEYSIGRFNNKYFTTVYPCNLFGKNDNYMISGPHVIPDMILKFHDAKKNKAESISFLGDGSPLREFLYVDDLAKAISSVANNFDEIKKDNLGLAHLNFGSGFEISIKDLTKCLKRVTGYEGKILFSKDGMNGTPRKVLDSTKIKDRLGICVKMDLKKFEEQLRETYADFCSRYQ